MSRGGRHTSDTGRGGGGSGAEVGHVPSGQLGHDLRTHEGGEEGSGCSQGRESFK